MKICIFCTALKSRKCVVLVQLFLLVWLCCKQIKIKKIQFFVNQDPRRGIQGADNIIREATTTQLLTFDQCTEQQQYRRSCSHRKQREIYSSHLHIPQPSQWNCPLSVSSYSLHTAQKWAEPNTVSHPSLETSRGHETVTCAINPKMCNWHVLLVTDPR